MSIPGPMKVTGLTVKNTLHASDAWIDNLAVKDKTTKKSVDIFDYVNQKVESVKALELKLNTMIKEIETAVQEITNMKINMGSTPTDIVDGAKGDKGDPGPVGPAGVGKVGPRGLRGQRGENAATKLSALIDVDLEDLKDGCALIYSKGDGKWTAQAIFDE